MADNIYGTTELWSYLKEAGKPIILYGMGNGADKIISVLQSRGLDFDDVFASDEFVREKLFHGKKVLRLSDIEAKYDDFIILVSFGSSLPEVLEKIYALAEKHELYAPDVPVAGEALFDASFFRENEEKILSARALLADERSKEIYDELIRFKLDGKISHFKNTDRGGGLFSDVLSGGYDTYIDLGAYTGDTVDEALACYPDIKNIIAFEPSEKTFKKLEASTEKHQDVNFTLVNACASDRDDDAVFSDGGGRNSLLTDKADITKTASGAKIRRVTLRAPDGFADFCGRALLVKLDVEGAEKEALAGTKNAIVSNLTELTVALYHRSEDIFALPLLVHAMLPHHELYIEKTSYIPAWEINLYAVVRHKGK